MLQRLVSPSLWLMRVGMGCIFCGPWGPKGAVERGIIILLALVYWALWPKKQF